MNPLISFYEDLKYFDLPSFWCTGSINNSPLLSYAQSCSEKSVLHIYLLKQQRQLLQMGCCKSQESLHAYNVVYLYLLMHVTSLDGSLAFVDSARDKDKPSCVTDGCVICR